MVHSDDTLETPYTPIMEKKVSRDSSLSRKGEVQVDKRKKLMLSALLAGCLAMLAAYKWTGNSGEEAVQATELALANVLVAKEEIAVGVALGADNVAVQQTVPEAITEGALTSLSQAQGRYARERILQGEQLVPGRLLDKGQTYALPVNIPPGKRAVSIGVNEVIGVAGFIKPGDFVDVLGTFDEHMVGRPVTATVLQKVQVLAISQEMTKEDSTPAKVSTSATLAVSLEQAQRLTLAEERGRLRLVLRPPQGAEVSGKNVTTPDELIPGMTKVKLDTPQQKEKASAGVPQVNSVPIIPIRETMPADSARDTVFVEVIRGVEKETLELDKH